MLSPFYWIQFGQQQEYFSSHHTFHEIFNKRNCVLMPDRAYEYCMLFRSGEIQNILNLLWVTHFLLWIHGPCTFIISFWVHWFRGIRLQPIGIFILRRSKVVVFWWHRNGQRKYCFVFFSFRFSLLFYSPPFWVSLSLKAIWLDHRWLIFLFYLE